MRTDLIINNARVYTMDGQCSRATALAVGGGRVLAVGADLSSWADPGTQQLDVGGRTVIPGLIDAHTHFVGFSLRQLQVDLDGIGTLAGAVEKVRQRAATLPPGSWVTGGGWNKNLWGSGAFPTRHDLDFYIPDHPVVLKSKDGHASWCNTRALETAGVGADTPCPPGSEIVRDAGGYPTGIFKEGAASLIWKAVPAPGPDELDQAITAGIAAANRLGLTGVHAMEGALTLSALQRLQSRRLRFLVTVPLSGLEAAIALGVRTGLGDEWVRVGQVKMFADGALGSQTAYTYGPYVGEEEYCGIATVPIAELAQAIKQAAGVGLGSAVHAIGDRANREVLDAFAAARDQSARTGVRQRIEHAQLLTPEDLPRFAALGVIASMQPFHAVSDRHIADRYWGDRARWAYAFRSLAESGAVLAFGSDAPVENIDPLTGISAAVTRIHPDEPGSAPWYPEERLTVYQAVWAYTCGAAFASGEEHYKGSLAPGKFADLVVLDRDIFSLPPTELKAARVVATMVGGRWVYPECGLEAFA